MIKKTLALLVSTLLLSFHTSAIAQDSSKKGFDDNSYSYVGVRGGRAELDSDDIDDRLDHDYYYYYRHGSHYEDDDNDVAVYSIFYGKRIPAQPLRLELEFTHNNGLDFVHRDSIGVETKSQRLMLNMFYDYEVHDRMFLNFGAGIGAANNKISGLGLTDNDSTQFAFSLGLGATYKIRPRIGLEFGYRYVNLGDVEYTNADLFKTNDNLVSHEVYLGAKYLF